MTKPENIKIQETLIGASLLRYTKKNKANKAYKVKG